MSYHVGVPTCDRCGTEKDRLDITNFGDPKPRYVYVDCSCPQPSCPFCEAPLATDRCGNIDCFMVGQVIPLPVLL